MRGIFHCDEEDSERLAEKTNGSASDPLGVTEAWTCRSNAAQAAQLHTYKIQPIPVGKRAHLAELELAVDC